MHEDSSPNSADAPGAADMQAVAACGRVDAGVDILPSAGSLASKASDTVRDVVAEVARSPRPALIPAVGRSSGAVLGSGSNWASDAARATRSARCRVVRRNHSASGEWTPASGLSRPAIETSPVLCEDVV